MHARSIDKLVYLVTQPSRDYQIFVQPEFGTAQVVIEYGA